jgi:hypothetical protein
LSEIVRIAKAAKQPIARPSFLGGEAGRPLSRVCDED